MILPRNHIERLLFLLAALLFPVLGFAQYPQPTSLSASPNFIYLPAYYSLCAGNGAYMTLDIVYSFSGGGGGPIYGWPSLGSGGCASIYADQTTALGTYYFTAAKNTLNSDWVSVYTYVTTAMRPPDFSISINPGSRAIDQGQSTTYSVSTSGVNGFSSYVWLSLTTALPAGVSASFNPNPVYPANSSTLTLSASSSAPAGSVNFTVHASGGGITHPTSANVTVNLRQPTSLSFSPNAGYAGNTCYTLTAGNGADMAVDLRYLIDVVQYPDATIAMDANGQWRYCLRHDDRTGVYRFIAIKNHLRPDWVNLSPSVNYTLYPPNPTSLSIAPDSVTAGQASYRMTAGNGAGVTLDTRYSVNGGPAVTAYGWPSLGPVSPGSPDGYADVWPVSCTPPGTYSYTQIENSQNGIWVSVAASVGIYSPGPPAITSVTPAAGTQGTNVDVTIRGTNLCAGPAAGLTTTWPGLTFSNVLHGSGFVQATFYISSSASLGNAPVTFTAGGGSTTFAFTVMPPVGLTKEYIYLGPRVIATEAP